jgi:hypothetical protein
MAPENQAMLWILAIVAAIAFASLIVNYSGVGDCC